MVSRLYILMRTDLASMNPGKAMAQASHAYGALKHAVSHNRDRFMPYYGEWQDQTNQRFGTTIVLGASERQIEDVIRQVRESTLPVLADWVLDPTYPLRDGEVTHLISLHTCAIVFGAEVEAHKFVEHLELHP